MESRLSESQMQLWEAAILGDLGVPDTASVSVSAARSAATTADIFDSSELSLALDGSYKNMGMVRAAQLIILDPPYGLFPEDAYDESPDPEKLAILIKYLKEEVCLTRVT